MCISPIDRTESLASAADYAALSTALPLLILQKLQEDGLHLLLSQQVLQYFLHLAICCCTIVTFLLDRREILSTIPVWETGWLPPNLPLVAEGACAVPDL